MSSKDGARYLDKALCTLALALAPALLLGGCGKKGPPLPPLRYVPAQTQDLAVAQRGDQILLRFTYPKTTAGGAALESVTEIDVYEIDRPMPPAPPPTPPAPAATATTPATTTTGATSTAPKTGTAPATTAPTPATTTTGTTATPSTPSTTAKPTTSSSAATTPSTTTTPPATTPSTTTTTPPGTTTPATGTTPKPGASGVPPTPAVGAPSVPPPPANLPGNFPPIDARELDATAKVKMKLQGADVAAAILGDKVVIALPVGELHPAPPAPAAGSTAGTTAGKGSTKTMVGGSSTAPKSDKSSKATATEKSSTERTAGGSTGSTSSSSSTTTGKTTTGATATGATAPTAPTDLVRYYAVRTTGPKGDRSAFSNQAAILPKPPPPPPGDLHLTPKADGIEVAWDAPAGTDAKGIVTASGIKVLGFNVYRRDATAKAFGPPIRAAFFDSRKIVDQTARFGDSYIYAVASIADVNPLRESVIRGESEVKYVDRFPPPVPADVVALAESGKVRIVWRASAAPDLAGYLIYRRAGARGDFQKLTAQPVTEVQYLDGSVSAGISYTYRVTAVDQSGNESAPGEAQTRAQ
jgi:hypothetical protein